MLINFKYLFSKVCKKIKLNTLFYKIFRFFYSKDNQLKNVDIEECRNELDRFYKNNTTSSISENNIHKKNYNLQVIITSYNNEKYLKKCIESVTNQKTKYKYKIVIIDDESTDNSRNIIDQYKNYENIEIIYRKNGGTSAARNSGINNIYADYIIFLDSDDYMADNAIETLLDCAYKNDADVVQGTFVSLIDDKEIKIENDDKEPNENNLRGFDWDKVIKAELYKKIIYPVGCWFDDTILSFLIYPQCKKICLIDDVVNYHLVNKEGMVISVVGKNKSLDTYWATEMLDNNRQELGYENNELYFEKLKGQFLMNYRRVYLLPEYIKKDMFYLESDLLSKRFPDETNDEFMNAIKNRNYKLYNLYAYWH